jgi:hypothetical protein
MRQGAEAQNAKTKIKENEIDNSVKSWDKGTKVGC